VSLETEHSGVIDRICGLHLRARLCVLCVFWKVGTHLRTQEGPGIDFPEPTPRGKRNPHHCTALRPFSTSAHCLSTNSPKYTSQHRELLLVWLDAFTTPTVRPRML
jgi:hypothetical protein